PRRARLGVNLKEGAALEDGGNRRKNDLVIIAPCGHRGQYPILAETRMRRRLLLAPIALGALMPAPAFAQHFASADKITKLSAPVLLDTTGMFQAKIARVGDDMFVAGQPTEKALRDMKAQGVTTVVNLRTPVEMTRSVKFDEPALVAQLGMKY